MNLYKISSKRFLVMYRKVNDESELDDVERRRGYENFPNTSLAVDSLPEVKTPKVR